MKEAKNTEVTVNDVANSKIVAKAVAIGTKNIEAEFGLLEPLAKLLLAGKISVRGVQATIEAVEAELSAGGEKVKMATLRTAHAQYLVNAWELSQMAEAPKNIALLCQMAKHYRASLDVEIAKNFDSKAEAVNSSVRTAVEQGTTFTELRKATPKTASTPKPKNQDSRQKNIELSAKSIAEFASMLQTISSVADIDDEEVFEALAELASVIESILN